jgi:prophage regulatory protein
MDTDVRAPQLLTVREVADRLKLSEKSVRRRIASGELPAVRLGGRGTQLRVDERELDQYVYGDAARAPASKRRGQDG